MSFDRNTQFTQERNSQFQHHHPSPYPIRPTVATLEGNTEAVIQDLQRRNRELQEGINRMNDMLQTTNNILETTIQKLEACEQRNDMLFDANIAAEETTAALTDENLSLKSQLVTAETNVANYQRILHQQHNQLFRVPHASAAIRAAYASQNPQTFFLQNQTQQQISQQQAYAPSNPNITLPQSQPTRRVASQQLAPLHNTHLLDSPPVLPRGGSYDSGLTHIQYNTSTSTTPAMFDDTPPYPTTTYHQ